MPTSDEVNVVTGAIMLSFTPLFLIFIYLLHRQRAERIIAVRSYFFMCAQHVGTVIIVVLNCVQMLRVPHQRGCQLVIWTQVSFLPLWLWPFIMRCLVYLFRYYVTQERKAGRFNSRLIRLLRYISPRLLFRVWLVVLVALLSIMFSMSITLYAQGSSQDDVLYPSCSRAGMPVNISTLMYGVGVPMAFMVFLTAAILWRSQDAYYIKAELYAAMILYTPLLVMGLAGGIKVNGKSLSDFLPGPAPITIAQYLSFLVSCVAVYFLSKKTVKIEENLDLKDLLRDPHFHSQFSHFLVLQLSIENLQFWDAVEIFRQGGGQADAARDIYNKFIKKGSVCQVNISGTSYQQADKAVTDGAFSPIMFDEAQREIMHILLFHSYPLYKNTTVSESSSYSLSAHESGEVV
eukprot:TRINITY_DN621_c0_g1_i5.p1 TRINITY_DN621_c0_g1~~TRINITY_DN621_c0_g1_i5.p1  ORF type:complete len:404 (+),score=77.11 TRINITY_DN621_c0_g1_i5:148-1359(+)